jgi:glycosyltransferase involved in cell wall biosynthesis
VFLRKQRAFADMDNLTIVSPSRWLAEKVRESPLLGGRRIQVIPNGLDTSVFSPKEKEASRRKLNIPAGKKIILFGAIRATQTPLKGFSLLIEAMKLLNQANHQLIVFGSSDAGQTDITGVDVRFMGEVGNTATLIDLYAAADVVAVPSLQEAFGQAASEALACGIPVVAFGATGLLDIVDHEVNGFLSKPFDTRDLAKGIEWVLANEDRHRELSRAARRKAETHFDIRIVARHYSDLYKLIWHADQTR